MFRTLYCSADPLTCLREKLAPLRPSLEAIEEYERVGVRSWSPVTGKWRRINMLADGHLEITSGDLLDLADIGVRISVALSLKSELAARSLDHLDLGHLQGNDYDLTQAVARLLFDRGAAGLVYRSRFDGERCAALFEGRARLQGIQSPRSLSESIPELDKVCKEFHILPP
jgi:hypothetical protein